MNIIMCGAKKLQNIIQLNLVEPMDGKVIFCQEKNAAFSQVRFSFSKSGKSVGKIPSTESKYYSYVFNTKLYRRGVEYLEHRKSMITFLSLKSYY